jgi:Uma2 family endonuclease
MAQLLKGPFTVVDYHRMVDCGILREGDPVELLEGQVVVMMSIGIRHAACVDRLTQILILALRGEATVRVQGPIVLDDGAEPEPDIAIFKQAGPWPFPGHPRPEAVFLVIEVADSSLAYDRDIKIPLYAKAGIPEVWLIDLTTDTAVVYRNPLGDAYQDIRNAGSSDVLNPHLLQQVSLRVEEIIPAH